MHDSHIFRLSNIHHALEGTNFEHSVLLGYGCQPYLTTPYLEPRTPHEKRFNRALKVTRSLIERTFGVLKRRFHVLHAEIRMGPERVCTIVVTRCILHNIAVDHNELLPDLKESEHSNEDVNSKFLEVETGQAVRDHIANTYF